MRTGIRTSVRYAFVILAVSFLGAALAADWQATLSAVRTTEPIRLGASFLFGAVGMMVSYFAWRSSLAALGSALSVARGARVFFVGQLGKYIPGAVWPVLAQSELARDLGVPRARTAAAFTLTLLVSAITGAFVAVLGVPASLGEVPGAAWFAVLPAAALSLHPRIFTAALRGAEKLTRRRFDVATPGWGDLLRIGMLCLLMWLALGAHLAALLPSTPADTELTLAAIGAMALAWVAGLLVVVLPAGVGVREAVLLLALGTAVGQATTLLVVLLSRVLLTVSDLMLAGAAAASGRRRGGAGRRDR